MNKKPKGNEPIDIPQMPFNDALKKILSAPPQHKAPPTKKKAKTKK
ncbi:MAG TPA: hypothetical protein VFA72_17670 [Burkholderiales bacterium]|nr:hypothetical protein [Burkholderiales bacterium]